MLRGLHFRSNPQTKLVRVVRGAVFDGVDLSELEHMENGMATLGGEQKHLSEWCTASSPPERRSEFCYSAMTFIIQ
ncbi:MAG: hypothetical protein ACLUI3_05215 [Christensenellales bacterium]